jgi:hypothetical protein
MQECQWLRVDLPPGPRIAACDAGSRCRARDTLR